MGQWIETLDRLVWGPGLLAALLLTGGMLTVRLRFLPWRRLPWALGQALRPGNANGTGLSPFQALMTSLAATVGTGTIVGVASAMVLGGPGALAWMWLSAAAGMATKFAECTLASRWRTAQGGGGPMNVLQMGVGGRLGRVLAVLWAAFALCAAFGIGCLTQANALAEIARRRWGLPPLWAGLALAALSLAVLAGGAKRVGAVCGALVPVMGLVYLAAAWAALLRGRAQLPGAFAEILAGAVRPGAWQRAARWGIACGVFSHEAGLGSAGIAAAAARTDHPARQGYVAMTGVFLDAMVLCTLTGLVLAVSGVLGRAGTPEGLAARAFGQLLGPAGTLAVDLSLGLFALSTLLGWEFYGETALCFLTEGRGCRGYRLAWCAAALSGACLPLRRAWTAAELCNGLLALPNLAALWLLHGQVEQLCREFEEKRNGTR